MYNINSIIELPDYKYENSTLSTDRAGLNAIYPAIRADGIDGLSSNTVSSYNFALNLLKPNTYIEVSYKDELDNNKQKSAKLNLHDLMLKLYRTVAWIAYLNTSGLTKDEADRYYVPMSGTTTANPMTGPLHISAPGQPALSVDGSVHFIYNNTTRNSQVIFHDIEDASTSYVEFDVPLTANGGIFCRSTTIANELCALKTAALTANNITGDFKSGSITASNITCDDTIKGQNISAYAGLSAADVKTPTATITTASIATANITTANTTSLTAANLTATNLCAGGTGTNGYSLSALASTTDVDGTNYYVKTKAIYGATVGTDIFIASNIQALDTFEAVKVNNAFKVRANSTIGGLSATKLETETFEAKNIIATESLRCSAGNQFNASSSGTTIKNASCTDLECEHVAQLTARYACWA